MTEPYHLLLLLPAVVFLALIIAAIIATARNESLPASDRVVRILILVFVPPVGLLIWLVYWLIARARRSNQADPL